MLSVKIVLKKCSYAILILFMAGSVMAEIINIPEDRRTIQAGIDASEDGDTVLVQPGNYVENITFSGKAILLTSLIMLEGNVGYIDSTVIDGDQLDCVVCFDQDEDSTSVLRGFTIRNGTQRFGGGIDCQRASPHLIDLIVTENSATSYGGGIYCTRNANAIIERVLVFGNVAGWGGGIGNVSSCPIVRNSIITQNVAGHGGNGKGGGLFAENGSYHLKNVFISDNTADLFGGISVGGDDRTILSNVTIVGNDADVGGGIGFYTNSESTGGSSGILENCIIWNNTGIQIYSHARGEGDYILDISYCNIQNGEDSIRVNGDAQMNWNEGNIADDPLFVDPDEGDFHLSQDSPCIDAGDPESDPDPDGTRTDMGAFYFHQNFPPVVVNGIDDIIIDEDSGLIMIADLDEVFQDANGDELTFDWITLDTVGAGLPGHPLGLDLTEDNVLTMEPVQDLSGNNFVVWLGASDAEETIEITFRVTINPMPDPPQVFPLISPADSSEFGFREQVTFRWETSRDPDPGSHVQYSFNLLLWDWPHHEQIVNQWVLSTDADSLVIQFDTLQVDWGCVAEPFEWFVYAQSDSDQTESENHFQIIVYGPGEVKPENASPQKFGLNSIYPNPFNSSTTISYFVPVQSAITIEIVDISGRLVESLTSRVVLPGQDNIVWDGGHLDSGVYLVRMMGKGISEYSSVRKIVLVK